MRQKPTRRIEQYANHLLVGAIVALVLTGAVVPAFGQENEVTYSGEVVVEGDPAVDGASYSYDIVDGSGASDPTGTLTGVEATEWDNATASGLADGDTLAVDPAGHEIRGPANGEPEVRFTGEEQTTPKSASGTVSDGGSESITNDGNAEPEGPASGNPELSISGNQVLDGREPESGTISVDPSKTISLDVSGIEYIDAIYAQGAHGYSSEDVDITISGQTQRLEGLSGSGSEHVVEFNPIDVSGVNSIDVTLETVSGNSVSLYTDTDDEWGNSNRGPVMAIDRPTNIDVSTDTGQSVSFGTGGIKAIDLQSDTSQLDFSFNGAGSVDWTLDYDVVDRTEAPSVDIDGDGSNEISHSGMLAGGETATYEVASLGPSDNTATISTAGGSTVGVEVRLKEVVKTQDASIELNGEQVASVSGTLADGESANFSASSSVLKNGTNRMNVTVGDGSLSSDAPAPQVGLDYSHTARDNQTVSYTAEAWSERYNISREWSGARENASVTIPFKGNVITNRALDLYINGSKEPVAWSRFKSDSTTLRVGMGNVDPGTTTRVVANGSKVRTINGSVEVVEPTVAGNKMNTTIKVTDSDSNGVTIDVSGTSSEEFVHYLEEESWQQPGAHVIVEDAGLTQKVRMPNASAGSTARVRTVPLEVDPLRDVRVEMIDADQPKFEVGPAETLGDSVTYEWHGGETGTTYELVSQTRDGYVIDSDTAESPAVLSTDSDDSEILFIRAESSGSSSDDSGGSFDVSGGTVPVDQYTGPIASPIGILAVAVVAVLGGGIAVSATGAKRWVAIAVAGVVVILSIVALIPDTVGAVLFRFGIAGAEGFGSVSSALWLGGGAIGLWALYRIIKRFTGRQDVNLQVRRGGK